MIVGTNHLLDHDELRSEVLVNGENVEEAEAEEHDVERKNETCRSKTTQVTVEAQTLQKPRKCRVRMKEYTDFCTSLVSDDLTMPRVKKRRADTSKLFQGSEK